MSDEIQEREVARRVFAAEFDDATLSYSESDEERAPNYVVTPTGARVNRLFAVGALTEVERVNDDVLRGRISDPTGAFVTYGGQYQPDAAAFLERATPPCFVSITGKGRTYQPEDSDRIFTSVRPESLNEVDADTRDRWVVAAADATLGRLATMAAALDLDARGDDLRTELESRGVDAALARGVALAIDHYRPTEFYLEAVRRLTLQALELVVGDRDTVDPLDVAPGEPGPDELGPLPDVPAASPTPGDGTAGAGAVATDAATDGDSPSVDADDAAGEAAGDGSTAEPADGTPAPDPTDDAEPTGDASVEPADEPRAADPDTVGAASGSTDPTTSEPTPSDPADPDPSLPTDEGDDATAAARLDSDSGSDDLGDFGVDDAADESEMYELDEAERAEIESEYGTEFATGNEVDDPGEADIDVPDVEDLEAEAAAAAEGDAAAADDPTPGAGGSTPGAAAKSDPDAGGTDGPASTGTPDVDAADADAGDDEPADDVDLETAAVDVMSRLDDGDGADREAVVSAVADAHGADPDAVESAIQDALMGGKCYEPAEGRLKAI